MTGNGQPRKKGVFDSSGCQTFSVFFWLIGGLIFRHWFPWLMFALMVVIIVSGVVTGIQADNARRAEQIRLKAEEAARRAEEAERERLAREVAKARTEAYRAEAEAAKSRTARAQAEAAMHRASTRSADSRWSSSDPYTILGVARGTDRAAIRAAYGRLSKQYHPDRVASLGPEFQELAEARMKTINAAYQAVKRA